MISTGSKCSNSDERLLSHAQSSSESSGTKRRSNPFQLRAVAAATTAVAAILAVLAAATAAAIVLLSMHIW